jgi:uncharacterized protein YndB with AHSA1/START domain
MTRPSPKPIIQVEAVVEAPPDLVWKLWTTPEDIMRWNNASDTWHTPAAHNDLRTGGAFLFRMEARDGTFGFDFGGVYDSVKTHESIAYTMGDGRKVEIGFTGKGTGTRVVETFEAESQNPIDVQRNGWQSILNNFKKYAEEQL